MDRLLPSGVAANEDVVACDGHALLILVHKNGDHNIDYAQPLDGKIGWSENVRLQRRPAVRS